MLPRPLLSSSLNKTLPLSPPPLLNATSPLNKTPSPASPFFSPRGREGDPPHFPTLPPLPPSGGGGRPPPGTLVELFSRGWPPWNLTGGGSKPNSWQRALVVRLLPSRILGALEILRAGNSEVWCPLTVGQHIPFGSNPNQLPWTDFKQLR